VQKFTEAEAAALKEFGFEINEYDTATMNVGNNHVRVEIWRLYGKVTAYVSVDMQGGTLRLSVARDALLGAIQIFKP
jgi:hypothetical protein